jgi:intraflagellar transport protein 52
VVFGCPRERFSAAELDAIKRYVHEGGNVLVLAADGGERAHPTNLNVMLEEFGVTVNPDSVVRSSYHKYTHPKEVLIASGVINREINAVAGKREGGLKARQAQT